MASSNGPKINKHPDAGVQVQVQVQGPRSRCSWPKIAQGKTTSKLRLGSRPGLRTDSAAARHVEG